MTNVDEAIAAVLAGQRDAFRTVVETYESSVRVVLAAMLPDPHAVDDLVHEVFVTAYVRLGKYRPGTDLRAWLKSIARNLALNERRGWLRRQAALRPLDERIERHASAFLEGPELLGGDDILRRLDECVRRLAPGARAVVEQYYFEGVSARDLASAGGRTESAVWVALHRAREALLGCLRGKGILADG